MADPVVPPYSDAWYTVVRFLFWAFCRVMLGIEARGQENMPKTGAVLIAPNHLSNLDPPVMGGTSPRRVRAMGKSELFTGFVGFVLSKVGVFPVRRGEGDTEAIRISMKVLEDGAALLLFPEGTRGDGQTMGEMQRGLAMMAKRTGAPICPVGIMGTHKALGKGSSKLRRSKCRVYFGKTFTYADVVAEFGEKAAKVEFDKRLAREIQAAAAQAGQILALPPSQQQDVS